MNTESITGHRRQLALLSTMIETGKIPQAMLFSGVPGIGKAKTALLFLSALFCRADDRPCGTCRTCQQIQNRTFPDLIELYPDEKGRIPLGNPEKREPGSIRWLIERLSCRPLAEHRGVIIDGADTISTEGQNALLKSIEEPQENTHIILIAANRSRVLPPVISRCTAIPFNPLSFREVTGIIGSRCGDAALAEAAAALSGGSLETAAMAMDGKLMDKVIDLCGHISAYLNGGAPITVDPPRSPGKSRGKKP
jgi:DNA polymerase-3 subunit delta'